MAVEHHAGGTMITGDDIERFRLIALKERAQAGDAGSSPGTVARHP